MSGPPLLPPRWPLSPLSPPSPRSPRSPLPSVVAALCGTLVATAVASAAEPLSIADLARFRAASQAMERGDADASGYRAGRYDGYLGALTDVLQAKGEVCLPACSCQLRDQLDPVLERQLGDPALDRSQAAAPWLEARLREAFPCLAPN